MKILAIETSCDETAASIVENGLKVLSNVIASQIDIHQETGGVVPEVAAREHVLQMVPVLDKALREADCQWEELDAVAVTEGPGLVSSLLIGRVTAQMIAEVKGLPLILVNHISGHLYSNWLDHEEEVALPALILTVSGGHNELILMKEDHSLEHLGRTRDDAAGEAFDKVARMLGLGYPGGPEIARLAVDGDREAFDFPRVMLEKESLDFSFSGLKTAVLSEVKEYIATHGLKDESEFSESFKKDIAASFQEAVVETLAAKLMRALERYPQVREIHLAGGVSANLRLREKIEEIKRAEMKFRYPQSLKYCTDNAAMIGAAGYYSLKKDSGLLY